MQGTFYEQELQLSVQEIFRIERVRRKRKNQVFVKWNGCSDALNMNISKQYAWRPGENNCEDNPLLPQNLRGLVIGKSGSGKTAVICNLLLQTDWLDYGHSYLFRKNLHQQEYKVLREGLQAGLSKQQISNLFNSQEALGNISPRTAIEKCSGARTVKIRGDFYDDCQDIPDPSALDTMQKKLLLLDDCFLSKQRKAEAYYTRG